MAYLLGQEAVACHGKAGHLEGVAVGMKLDSMVVLELEFVAAASVTGGHPRGS